MRKEGPPKSRANRAGAALSLSDCPLFGVNSISETGSGGMLAGRHCSSMPRMGNRLIEPVKHFRQILAQGFMFPSHCIKLRDTIVRSTMLKTRLTSRANPSRVGTVRHDGAMGRLAGGEVGAAHKEKRTDGPVEGPKDGLCRDARLAIGVHHHAQVAGGRQRPGAHQLRGAVGGGGKLKWTRNADGLTVTLPKQKPCQHAKTTANQHSVLNS